MRVQRERRAAPPVFPLHRGPSPRLARRGAVAATLVALLVLAAAPVSAVSKTGPLGTFKHIVVIYEENHSFDNLYGRWGDVNGQHVVGLADADNAHTWQYAQDGTKYTCLLQDDLNLRTTSQSSGHLAP